MTETKERPTGVVAGIVRRFTPPATSVSVSDVGSSLSQSLAAAGSVLEVVNEINTVSGGLNDPNLKLQLERWADTLTDAVIEVSSSADSTATEISSLYAPSLAAPPMPAAPVYDKPKK